MDLNIKHIIAHLAKGNSLSQSQSYDIFGTILDGKASPAQIAALLMALRVRGETLPEITGAVQALRAHMLPVKAPAHAIDIVGTGGDERGTFNVSTLASLLVAACGVPVAKHGNRAVSSLSGASDVLTALGVRVGLPPEEVGHAINTIGIGFMMAQVHHPAMRHVAPIRADLGIRTIFNILGPLSNPAGVKRHLIGCFSSSLLEPLALVLKELGSEHVWIVRGDDGLDEVTTTGPSQVVALRNGHIQRFEVTPEQAGLTRVPLSALQGGAPEQNAHALENVLRRQEGYAAYRDIALLNAAAALMIAEQVTTLAEGVKAATQALTSGAALAILEKLRKI